MTIHAKNFIAGEWVASAKRAGPQPVEHQRRRRRVPARLAADAERAIAAAKAAFPAWSRSTPQERHDILKRVGDEILARKDELGRLLSREEGKTLPEGVGEVVRAGQIFLFFSGEALRLAGDKLASVRPGVDVEMTREPVGVVGLITPWNFPIAIPAWKIAPALAYGNCVVLKPADLVPATAHALVRDHRAAGLPAGVFNLVMGRGSVVGETLLEHQGRRCRSRSPARSRPAARSPQTCIAADPMKKVQLEMGGKNPMVVLDDADLKIAVECAVNGAFFSTGQRCTASSRAHRDGGDPRPFVDAMAERMKGLVVDDALKAGTISARWSTRASSTRTSPTSRSAATRARSWSPAASSSTATRPASTCRPRSSPTWTTTCASRARKSSGRSRR